MRNLRYKIAASLIILTLSTFSHAELIYGFNKVAVTKALTTSVEFDQDDFKNYQITDNLKLRAMDGIKIIREDAILNKDGAWIWNKILPFSENLKFVILKDDKPISTEYLADTRSSLTFSDNTTLPMVRGVHYLSAIAMENNRERRPLPIEIPEELRNCAGNVLVIVFNKQTNALLWQYYGELKNNLTTSAIEVSEDLQRTIVTDESSCGN